MLSSKDSSKRWPRGQKFTLSSSGAEAAAEYRATVVGARASGRAVLDSALAAWAAPRSILPGDGILLPELAGKRLGLTDLFRSLEPAGVVPAEVRDALGRLVDAGIVDPVPLAPRLAP